MDEGEADRWIKMLGTSYERATKELEKLGEPALRRLLEVCEFLVRIPLGGGWPEDVFTCRAKALGRLGRMYPEVLIELVREKKYLKLWTIQGLSFSGDERLKILAKEALKVCGDDLGANYPPST